MPDFTFPKIEGFSFLAPRNSVGKPFETIFAAEDNALHDRLNGTYDRHFPLYALTNIQGASSDYRPSVNLIAANGTEKKLTGSITPTIFKEKINRREYGRKPEIHPTLGNQGLQLNTVYFREFLLPKFDPRYTLIVGGTFITNTIQKPSDQFTDLGATAGSSFEPFAKASLVRYKNQYWRCLEPTRAFPDDEDDNWQQLPQTQSIFTADIYSIFGSNVQFFQTYTEGRTFIPEQQDDSLVVWNVSCFYN